MKQIAKEGIRWEKDPDWGYEVPKRSPGRRPREVRPAPALLRRRSTRRSSTSCAQERREWLAKFPGLDPAIPKAVEKAGEAQRRSER